MCNVTYEERSHKKGTRVDYISVGNVQLCVSARVPDERFLYILFCNLCEGILYPSGLFFFFSQSGTGEGKIVIDNMENALTMDELRTPFYQHGKKSQSDHGESSSACSKKYRSCSIFRFLDNRDGGTRLFEGI